MDYYRRHVPDDLVPHWDFEVSDPENQPRDTSAAALVAYGLLSLPADDPETADLRAFGEDIFRSLLRDYLVTDPDDDRYGMVLHGCYDKPGEYATDNDLIWTDYYVATVLHQALAD